MALGRKGGKATAKKRTAEQRSDVAKKAAAARWAKPITQAELKHQSALQDAEWAADSVAQMGAEDIDARLADGAEAKPGKLRFDKKQKRATAATQVLATPSPEERIARAREAKRKKAKKSAV